MKKIFGLLLFVGLALTSCADDDYPYNPGEPDTTVLLKRKVITAPDGTQSTSTYNYDGHTLTSIIHNDGSSEQFNYAGDILTEVRYYQNGGLVRKDSYRYGNTGNFGGYLASYYDLQNSANSYAERFDYIFEGETATVARYRGTEQQQTQLVETSVVTVMNGNVRSNIIEGGVSKLFLYDFRNAPLENITAYSIFILTNKEGGINNEIARNVNDVITNTAYTYTEAEFPATATVTGGQNYTVTYTY
jgi:hypothetical protein